MRNRMFLRTVGFISIILFIAAAMAQITQSEDARTDKQVCAPTHLPIAETVKREAPPAPKAVFGESSTVADHANLGSSGLFGGIFGGNTMYDMQTTGTMQRQIQTLGNGSLVHFTWTCLKTPESYSAQRNVHYKTYDWSIPGWNLYLDSDPWGGKALHEAGNCAGWGNVVVPQDDLGRVLYHTFEIAGITRCRYAKHQIAGLPIFGIDALPELGGYDGQFWPQGTLNGEPASSEQLHVAGIHPYIEHPGGGNMADLLYWRYARSTSTWEGPVLIDSTHHSCRSHLMLVDNDRIIFAFNKPRAYWSGANPYDMDLAYYEDNNAGDDWIENDGVDPYWASGGGFNVTDYVDTDPHRAYFQLAGGFDSEGRLHLLYTNPAYDHLTQEVSVGPCELLHWDEGTPGSNSNAIVSGGAPSGFSPAKFHTIYSAMWGTPGYGDPNVGSSGHLNRYISHPFLTFGNGATTCDGGTNLDYMYVTYTLFGTPDPLDKADASAAGYQNGNIWMSISSDYGQTWPSMDCLTIDGGFPTRSPGCDPALGDTCLSEGWASTASVINDTLHILYVGDLDAGCVMNDEGSWTINDVMYLPLTGVDPNPLCPESDPACECGMWGDVNCDLNINPVDVVYMVNYVYKSMDARCYPVPWDCPYDLGDVDCSGGINPVDVVYFVNYVYKSLDAFCDPCG